MSINPLITNIQFGVASPPYQSRSAGTDFEDMLLQIKEELAAAEIHYTRNLFSLSGLSSQKRQATEEEAEQLLVSSLFKMNEAEFSLLDELLMTALEETLISAQKTGQVSRTGENSLQFQVSDRYKLDLSKMGKLLKLV